jgi:hypothetical protein
MTDAVTAAAVDDECLGAGATVRVRSSINGNPFGWPWTRTPQCSTPAAGAGRRGHLAPKPGEKTPSIDAIDSRPRSALVFRPVVC